MVSAMAAASKRMLGDTIGACVDLFGVIGSGLMIIDGACPALCLRCRRSARRC
jgi:hypothetical protein